MIKKIILLTFSLIIPGLSTASNQQLLTAKHQACMEAWYASESTINSNGKRGPYTKTIKCLSPIAEEGGLKALLTLGSIYGSSISADRNLKLSISFLLKGAEQGETDFYNGLAGVYNANSDYENAIKWYGKLYEQNDENLIVIAELATIYRKKGDFKTAFDLYLTVIKMDKRSPVFKLESAKAIGEMYAKGELGKKDKMRAYMWAKISTTMYSEYNHDSTIKFMDSLSLPIPSKISAKSKADICIDSEYNDC